MNVIDVPLDQIEVGERRRADMGDIGALAKGIQRVGLLEPIVVDRNGKKDHYRLIAGERRLRAVQMLRWKAIPAHLREHLTDAQMRDIELEENENRKSLTERERTRTFASSKKLVENAKKAGEVFAATTKTLNPKGGRPSKGEAPRQYAAGALGISEGTLRNAEKHVELAEEYPWMQGNDWRQSDVLRLGENLDTLKPEVREQALTVLGAAKILDPELTGKLISNIQEMKPDERKELVRLSLSTDPREQSLALTKAAQLPPMPDPRLTSLDAAITSLRRAADPFPKDPLTPRIVEVIQQVRKVRAAVKEVSYDARQKRSPIQ